MLHRVECNSTQMQCALIQTVSGAWIRDLRRIHPKLNVKPHHSTLATSLVHAKLDYCNSHFLNLDTTQINRIQAIQNALARTVTKNPNTTSPS